MVDDSKQAGESAAKRASPARGSIFVPALALAAVAALAVFSTRSRLPEADDQNGSRAVGDEPWRQVITTAGPADGNHEYARHLRETTLGTVRDALQRESPSAALDYALTWIPGETQDPDDDYDLHWPSSGEAGNPRAEAWLAHLEFLRDVLDEIESAAVRTKAGFHSRLNVARIRVDQHIARLLNPQPANFGWSNHTGLEDVTWWWDDVPEARESLERSEHYSAYGWHIGIAQDKDGKPIFLEAPAAYSADLPRSQKLLFVLDEIERLDDGPERDAAAAALFARARLMRRLYGPQTDTGWSWAEFQYMFDKRPSFAALPTIAGLKEVWELADDEARTKVAYESRVLLLPDSQNPLALLRRLEREYPHSASVPQAIHEQGLYYQSRRQFAKALVEYRRELARFPTRPQSKWAREQIERIEHADVILGQTGIYASGLPPKLWFAARNAAEVDFVARRFDLQRWIESKGFPYLRFDRFGDSDDEQVEALNPFVGAEVTRWTQSVARSNQVATHSARAPLSDSGAYLVEARARGSGQSSRGLVIVSGIAIVQRGLIGRVLLWAVDPLTGTPLPGQKIDVIRRTWSDDERQTEATLTTDSLGCVEYRHSADNVREHFDRYLIASAEGRGTTFCELTDPVSDDRTQVSQRALALTDRPVYRPGATVQFRIWLREQHNQGYQPAEGGHKLRVQIAAPHSGIIRELELESDASGSVAGSFALGVEAPLGVYRLLVKPAIDARGHGVYAGRFRVEEYKAPEFEVTISPEKAVVTPGDPIVARVEARYYFGRPVARGEVRYEVSRRPRMLPDVLPAEYDWLYGAGYGLPPSRKERDETQGYLDEWSWYGSDDSEESADDDLPTEEEVGDIRRRPTIATGRLPLDGDGVAEIRFDPPADEAPRGQGWQYRIDVHVRDEGRRTVDATGFVQAPQREFQALVELDRPWYAPGDSIGVELVARAPNNVPVTAEGRLRLLRLEADSSSRPREVAFDEWPVATGVDGRHSQRAIAPRPGRYRLEFRSRDSVRQVVTAIADFWVYDSSADLSGCPLPILEILPDRRTYQPGQTALLLLVGAAADASVLICRDQNEYRLLSLAGHTRILEVPITEREAPNVFVEATTVGQGVFSTHRCQVFVPPVHKLLRVALTADKSLQKPGEGGRFKVQVTDADGRPVSGDLALTAFDKAVTYIQPDSALGPKSLLVKQKRERRDWVLPTSTLDARQFRSSGAFLCPEYYVIDNYVPQIMAMGGAGGGGGDPGAAGQAGSQDARPESAADEMAAPTLRTDFSDTARWQSHLSLDALGEAETEIPFPQALTTWRLRGWIVTSDTRVGDVVAEVVTSKDLLVRLQRPRFLVERDEVVLSANVHNGLPGEKSVTAELFIPAALFAAPGTGAADAEGNLKLSSQALVPAGGSHRFDWTVSVVTEGLATITVKALTDEESDAMQTALPVRLHGYLSAGSQTGAFRPGDTGERTLTIDVPDDAHPAKTRVTLSLTPSPATAALQAIPYLVGYPYGCVEQTMSRFYPTVLAVRTLNKLGIDIKQLAPKSPQADRFPHRRPAQFPSSAELERMTEAGLQRLQKFQHADGGWGWWESDASSPYMTAYVVIGLFAAAESGAKVDSDSYNRALAYLLKLDERSMNAATGYARDSAQHVQMFVAYALSLGRPESIRASGFGDAASDSRIEMAAGYLADAAFEQRDALPVYDRLLLALTVHDRVPRERAAIVLKEVLDTIERDDAGDTAHVPVRARDYWRAWNSEVETNAWLLRALLTIDRENPVIPRLVNWLILNRRQGQSWRSTQETALAVTALSEYLAIVGAEASEQAVEVRLDQGPVTTVTIASDQIFGLDVVLEAANGSPPASGRHKVSLQRRGQEGLHFSLQTEFLRTDVSRQPQSNGLAIERRFYRRNSPAQAATGSGADAQATSTDRRPLETNAIVASGDLIEVELAIFADDDYEYVAFEDPKPAGCEPLQVRSGLMDDGGLWTNVELRDDRVVFFAGRLPRGKHLLRYMLRAESPGLFHALPARGFAMYAPEIFAQSDEMQLRISE